MLKKKKSIHHRKVLVQSGCFLPTCTVWQPGQPRLAWGHGEEITGHWLPIGGSSGGDQQSVRSRWRGWPEGILMPWLRTRPGPPCISVSECRASCQHPAATLVLGSAPCRRDSGSFLREENPQLPGVLLGTLQGPHLPFPIPLEWEALFPRKCTLSVPRIPGTSDSQGQRQHGQRVREG